MICWLEGGGQIADERALMGGQGVDDVSLPYTATCTISGSVTVWDGNEFVAESHGEVLLLPQCS